MSENDKEFKITAQGSLGLLALGDIGVAKWREAVKKFEEEHPEEVAAKKAELKQKQLAKKKEDGKEASK